MAICLSVKTINTYLLTSNGSTVVKLSRNELMLCVSLSNAVRAPKFDSAAALQSPRYTLQFKQRR
jgi:hypothetical protein